MVARISRGATTLATSPAQRPALDAVVLLRPTWGRD
jgi:hypothetical protein